METKKDWQLNKKGFGQISATQERRYLERRARADAFHKSPKIKVISYHSEWHISDRYSREYE